MLDVRYATEQLSDYESFMKLHKSFKYSESNPENEMEREMVIKNYEEYKEYIENIFFAVLNGEIIGYAVMDVEEDDLITCIIREIYVKSNLQKRGYGRSFVEEIKKVAKAEGFKKIRLISANITTDKIWFLLGFRPVVVTRDEYEINLK